MTNFISLFLIAILGFFMAETSKAELIVLAAPGSDDSYYLEEQDNIFDFHISFAKKILEHGDDVLIFTDADSYDDYVKELGPRNVVFAPTFDIWLRDFGASNPTNPLIFRYSAAGQGGGQKQSDLVQGVLVGILEDAGLSFIRSPLINDGGNFVDDYAGNAVISKKFLRDNKISEEDAREKLREFGVKNLAFIEADEQGGLEHADGVVSFVDENVLIINSYPDDPEYAAQLREDLKRGLPGVKIHEIVTPYDDSKIYDERFGSACGLYTNALVTPERIYLPQFGIKEDAIALKQVRAVTSREVIPVPSHQVCHMGGGVRCMSWQLRGKNAQALLDYFE